MCEFFEPERGLTLRDVEWMYFQHLKNLPDDDDGDDTFLSYVPVSAIAKMQPREFHGKNVTKFQISYGNDTNATAEYKCHQRRRVTFQIEHESKKRVFLVAPKKEIVP